MSRMGSGPADARVMIVGDWMSEQEDRHGEPFLGSAGDILNKMLHDAKIIRNSCYVTNVINGRIPGYDIYSVVAKAKKDITERHLPFRDKYVLSSVHNGYQRLLKEIDLIQPTIILACGTLAIWALTGAWGDLKWRGSILGLDGKLKDTGPVIIACLHPRSVMMQWELYSITTNDFKRAARAVLTRPVPPAWEFILRPSLDTVLSTLAALQQAAITEPTWIEVDLETRAGHIACCGLSWSNLQAISIPFMMVEGDNNYWSTPEEESLVIWQLYKLLTHPGVKVRWQNGLYDAQYIYRHWHFIPKNGQDTMISQHTLFSGMKKSLAFQASMYTKYYTYWKDDGKTWDKNVGEEQLWSYNCEDCVRTREVGEVELNAIQSMGLQEVEDFQQSLFHPVLQAMNRGVRIDYKARTLFTSELQEAMTIREEYFLSVLGHTLNPSSSPQMAKLFYEDLAQAPIKTRAKKGIPGHLTCDDEALTKIAQREPILSPLTRAIQEYRSLGVFLSTFVTAGLDTDHRMRCSFNICGTETYRFSSSKNPFNSGMNLQNIPKGGGDETFSLPNVRKLFIPDPGYVFFDMDLDRADLQVVVWEADEPELKAALRLGVDIHILNALALKGLEPPSLEELVETHERYPHWRALYKKERELAKRFIHGTNYGGSATTMSRHAGITVREAERFQNLYFGRYKGIKDWHVRIEHDLQNKRYVQNKFGYRRYYFERTDALLPEALAWIPQSTVANVIDRAWVNIYEQAPYIQILLQVHDSLAGQFPLHKTALSLNQLRSLSLIPIPYSDPLTIPVGIKTSPLSWGACE